MERWFYPPVCVLCGAPGEPGLDLCPGCRGDLPFNDPCCRRCARPLAADGLCGPCQIEAPHFDGCSAALRYESPVDWLVQRFKFDGRLSCGRVLSEILAQRLARSARPFPDVLVAVPLHRKRLQHRGFNQAAEIARTLSRRFNIPFHDDVLVKNRATEAQTGLADADARRRNLRGAISAARPAPQSVALVDDVMTTGATLSECARTLKRSGCRRVDLWVLARA